MMAGQSTDPRDVLETLIRERREDYASLSRMIGRNAAYVQQFIKRGVPRKLAETDRRTLARYFGVPEQLLGGPPEPAGMVANPISAGDKVRADDMVLVPAYSVSASAGHGAMTDEDRLSGHLAFRAAWLREIADGAPSGLSVIRVQGDSMFPTLADGDDILVDSKDAADRLRDGIYVLRVDDMLNVKRIAMHPGGRRFEVRSDNPAYPAWKDCGLDSVNIIGRVVWAGRKIS